MIKELLFWDPQAAISLQTQEFIREWENDAPFVVVHTSGSTGKPKAIQLQKAYMRISAMKTIHFLNLRENDTALLCLSPQTIAGKMMIVRAIVGKMRLVVGELTSDPLKNIHTPIDFAALVPMQLEKSVENFPEKLRNIRAVIIGGGPVPDKIQQTIKKQEITVYHTFGMTETISHVAMRKIGQLEEPFFTAMDHINFTTNEGKLIIHYPEIGYDELQTNDLVELSDPQHFKWLGRADFMINTGGVKINPEQVESVLANYLHVPFFVTGLPDETLGQKVVLVAESDKPVNLPEPEQLKQELPKYGMPKEIYYIQEFIRTNSNKINRIETLKQLEK